MDSEPVPAARAGGEGNRASDARCRFRPTRAWGLGLQDGSSAADQHSILACWGIPELLPLRTHRCYPSSVTHGVRVAGHTGSVTGDTSVITRHTRPPIHHPVPRPKPAGRSSGGRSRAPDRAVPGPPEVGHRGSPGAVRPSGCAALGRGRPEGGGTAGGARRAVTRHAMARRAVARRAARRVGPRAGSAVGAAVRPSRPGPPGRHAARLSAPAGRAPTARSRGGRSAAPASRPHPRCRHRYRARPPAGRAG